MVPLRPAGTVFALVTLTACGDMAKLPVSAGTGPDPVLPPLNDTWFPTVNIAPAEGWPPDAKPLSAEGTKVVAFADGLEHPRWLYVLPNGDVLVAETNRSPTEASGIKGRITQWFMKKAGAGGESANRITLLRDTDDDGVADERTVFIDGLYSPFGMALVGDDFYVANTDAVVRFPYEEGQTHITAPGEAVATLPAGPINQHWTKSLITSPGDTFFVVLG